MLKQFRGVAIIAMIACASPALANNPLDSGPLADFLNIFRQAAIPRQTVLWTHGYAPGTIVISTRYRRLYYVLGPGRAVRPVQ